MSFILWSFRVHFVSRVQIGVRDFFTIPSELWCVYYLTHLLFVSFGVGKLEGRISHSCKVLHSVLKYLVIGRADSTAYYWSCPTLLISVALTLLSVGQTSVIWADNFHARYLSHTECLFVFKCLAKIAQPFLRTRLVENTFVFALLKNSGALFFWESLVLHTPPHPHFRAGTWNLTGCDLCVRAVPFAITPVRVENVSGGARGERLDEERQEAGKETENKELRVEVGELGVAVWGHWDQDRLEGWQGFVGQRDWGQDSGSQPVACAPPVAQSAHSCSHVTS